MQRSVEGVRVSLGLGWVVLPHFTGRNTDIFIPKIVFLLSKLKVPFFSLSIDSLCDVIIFFVNINWSMMSEVIILFDLNTFFTQELGSIQSRTAFLNLNRSTTRDQLHQHSTCSFYIRKFRVQLFCAAFLCIKADLFYNPLWSVLPSSFHEKGPLMF